MKKLFARFKKQNGFIVAAELVLIATILVIGLIVGFVAVRDAVVLELEDIATAIGNLNQSYYFSGTSQTAAGLITFTAGSSFADMPDSGDGLSVIVFGPQPGK